MTEDYRDLVERAIRGFYRLRVKGDHPRTIGAMTQEVFAVGSTRAAAICREFGVDPDEPMKRVEHWRRANQPAAGPGRAEGEQ